MGELKALFGKEIVVYSVVPTKPVESKLMIFKRLTRLTFSWKGKKRRAFCEAFINSKITGKAGVDELKLSDFLSFLSKRFEKLFGYQYRIIYEPREILKGKMLVGECSSFKKRVTVYSGRHGMNETTMSCDKSALCYHDVGYAEDVLIGVC